MNELNQIPFLKLSIRKALNTRLIKVQANFYKRGTIAAYGKSTWIDSS